MVEQAVLDIRKRIEKAPISGGRGAKPERFNDLVFIPAQLAKRPVDYFKEKINAETVIGRLSKKPLKLSTPIMIAAMSFGALNKYAKIAIAKASSEAGTATNTGEGGMLPEERESAKILIAQYSTGRFGVDEQYLKSADAIEVKIGQGAKPGQGGLLMGDKVTAEIAKIRKVEAGKTVHSPAYHPDIKNLDDLRAKIDWLKKITGGKPIILKLGAGDIENDVELAVKSGADVIAIDGYKGGTAAAPVVMLEDVGVPILSSIVKARTVMDKMKSKQELIVGGGLNTGSDFAKALALGADAVFVASAILYAMGCTYCKLCYLGKCPVGLTTQDPKFMEKLDPNAKDKVVGYINACTEEIKMVAGAVGHNDVHKLCKNDLAALTKETAELCGIRFV